ncbi:MAG: OmpA family protein [Pirellulales bacterium]|nr:OmpA family protein [Pirellulales bacterium]
MRLLQYLSWMACSAACCFAAGCMVPKNQLTSAQSLNQMLAEQNRAQIAEIENLHSHSTTLEDKLIRAEEQIATIDKQWRDDRQRLAAFEQELTDGRGNKLPPGISTQLANLSRRYSSIEFDTVTGAAKLDGDVLFDSADVELKEDAQEMLAQFAKILQTPEARDLKLMVVGHTDSLKIARRGAREKFPDNFHLSSARALSVARFLTKQGVPENQVGVSGFGSHQPIASNVTAEQRRLNRRVEIFVLPPDAPVVGWTETTTSLY